MLSTLAFRHLLVHKGRSLFLLLGYGLGVGVMIVLLSVGEAMLTQSADVALVGGGEVTVLPQGIDIEAMRSGGISGMFFGIERARFLTRQLLGGPRHAARVRAVSPVIENKLLYLTLRGQSVAVRAGGEIPSRVAAVGAARNIVSGAWRDTPADSAWIAPTDQQLYDELDHFHLPVTSDSSWGEWHYFNLSPGPDEWWYITYLVGGEVPHGRWGGQLLISHRTPDGRYTRYRAVVPADSIVLDTTRADLTLGGSQVFQRNGTYTLTAEAHGATGPLSLSLTMQPEKNRFFPPVSLHEGAYPSGYVVPALSGTATGQICVGSRCVLLTDVPAYHDHNWGVWRSVSWDWGAARGREYSLLYGAVYAPEDSVGDAANGAPRLLVALVDSLGVRQILRAATVTYEGEQRSRGGSGPAAPARFHFVATRDADTVRIETEIVDFQATDRTAAGAKKFLQMRGAFTLTGTIGGTAVSDSGTGFFETYVE